MRKDWSNNYLKKGEKEEKKRKNGGPANNFNLTGPQHSLLIKWQQSRQDSGHLGWKDGARPFSFRRWVQSPNPKPYPLTLTHLWQGVIGTPQPFEKNTQPPQLP